MNDAMSQTEALYAVGGRVAAYYANGMGEHGRGTVISYSYVPTLTIETDDGQRFSWRYDLCRSLDENPNRTAGASLHHGDPVDGCPKCESGRA